MMKVYDSHHVFLCLLENMKDVAITERLDLGISTLTFQAPYTNQYIEFLREENYIETPTYSYVIKEIDMSKPDFFTVRCNPNYETLRGKLFEVFDVFDQSLYQSYKYCVNAVDWDIAYHSEDASIIRKQLPYVTALAMIREIAEQNFQELWFDTKKQIIEVWDKIGNQEPKVLFSNELKLKKLNKQSSTYDYATVLYPIGKDGLTIELVNNGRKYLENYDYTDKYLEAVWINEDYDRPELLLAGAQEYFNKINQPQASYSVQLTDIPYSLAIGDQIILIDKIKRIKQKQRVVSITRYPYEPERGVLEISNKKPDFAASYLKEQRTSARQLQYLKEVIANLK